MSNWYKKTITKAILILLALVTPVTAALSMVVLLGFSNGSVTPENLFPKGEKTYEESAAFEELMSQATMGVLENLSLRVSIETDGKYNPDTLVDIIDYYEKGKISGKNESGLAYTMGELAEWGRDDTATTPQIGNIVVCQKPDGTYDYYLMSEFQAMVEDGKLKLEISDERSEQFLTELKEGYYEEGYQYSELSLKDEKGQTLYTECWTFNNSIAERYAPDGAANILEVVNSRPELNGRLTELYDALAYALQSISTIVDQYQGEEDSWTEGNTNLTYLFVNEENKRVYTNDGTLKKYENVEKSLQKIREASHYKYVIVKPKLKDFESNIEVNAGTWREWVKSYDFLGEDYLAAVFVDTEYPVQDVFYTSARTYDQYIPYMRVAGMGLILSVVLYLVVLAWLTVTAGRSARDEEIHLNAFDRWKTELGAAAVILPWIFMLFLVEQNWSGFGYSVTYDGSPSIYGEYHGGLYYAFSISAIDVCVVVLCVGVTAMLFLAGYLSLIRRIKAKTLWKNSLLRFILKWIWKCFCLLKVLWNNRKVTWKTVVAFGGFVLLHWFAIMIALTGSAFFVFISFLMIAVEVITAYYLMKNAIAMEQIKKGIEEIASGNVNYQIPMEKMNSSQRQMAEMVNDIGNGLQRAVAESMKSERLKTDLITNVSHDIKTPLTSIINYVDLLKRENINDPKIQGYLDILEAKAQRLKTLTEDVVEASKVSSGNITLECMDVNLVEMLNQTIGEFSEKMEAKQLRIMATLPEEPAVIHVDGRRMWRVLENIFNNVAKYAMPGTRVYADLKIKKETVEFSLKNISEYPLNIKADELTERFIRGDISRSTEGSGLGLSIARSLTEMQGGKFNLYVDGDLFKVIIEFPKA